MRNPGRVAGAAVLMALWTGGAWADEITNLVVKDVALYAAQCDGRSNRGGAPRLELSVEPLAEGLAGQGSLLQFDLRPGGVSVVPPLHHITNAQLRLRSFQANNTRWKYYVVAYPLLAFWQEGIAGSNSTPIPWGPTSIGDVTPLYRSVTNVDTATNIFYNSDPPYVPVNTNSWAGWKDTTTLVARAGTEWGALSGRGIGTDIADRKMIDELWVSSNYPALVTYPTNPPYRSYFPSLTLTEEGLKVLTEWANGTLTNHGFNIWAVCPPTNDLVSVYPPRWSSREPLGAGPAWPAELVLFTGRKPGPQTILTVR